MISKNQITIKYCNFHYCNSKQVSLIIPFFVHKYIMLYDKIALYDRNL